MKTVREQMEIMDAYETVGSYRGAAALCSTTPKTVKRVVARARRGQVGRQPAPPRPRITAGVQALIAERVRQSDGRISAKRLLPVAQAAGYTGSARSFRRAVAQAKATWQQRRRSYRPWVPTPGQHLVVDYTPVGRWRLFRAVLAWSHYRFVRFATDETQRTMELPRFGGELTTRNGANGDKHTSFSEWWWGPFPCSDDGSFHTAASYGTWRSNSAGER